MTGKQGNLSMTWIASNTIRWMLCENPLQRRRVSKNSSAWRRRCVEKRVASSIQACMLSARCWSSLVTWVAPSSGHTSLSGHFRALLSPPADPQDLSISFLLKAQPARNLLLIFLFLFLFLTFYILSFRDSTAVRNYFSSQMQNFIRSTILKNAFCISRNWHLSFYHFWNNDASFTALWTSQSPKPLQYVFLSFIHTNKD